MLSKSQSGQSLIQVLISVAIMGVVITAMSSMFNSLNRESRATGEKLAAMDLEKVLIAGLADGSGCLYALTKPTPLTFNAAATMSDSAPLVIPIPGSPARLYSSYNPALPTPLGTVLTEVGSKAAPYSNSLIVSGISLELTGISGPKVSGRLRVDFDSTKTIRPIKPAYVSLVLQADVTNLTSAKFVSCQTTSALQASGGSGDWCGAFIGTNDNAAFTIKKVIMPCHGTKPTCAPGQTPVSGYGVPGWFCKSGYFYFGYAVNTVCPSGFTVKQLMTAVAKYTAATGSIEAGDYTPQSISYETLLTCTPN